MSDKERFEALIGKFKFTSMPLTIGDDGEYYSPSTFNAFRVFKAVTYSAQCEIEELKKGWHTDYIEKVSQMNHLKVDLKNTKDDLRYFRDSLREARKELLSLKKALAVKDNALTLAMNICDSVPTKLHTNGETEVERRIGSHVNNGQYQIIHSARNLITV